MKSSNPFSGILILVGAVVILLINGWLFDAVMDSWLFSWEMLIAGGAIALIMIVYSMIKGNK